MRDGKFYGNSWGIFPRHARKAIRGYHKGTVSLQEALETVSSRLPCYFEQRYVYDDNGNKIPKICIAWGVPVVCRFEFN